MGISVAGRNTGTISTAATSWPITVPSGANNGDLYLVCATPGSASTLSTTSTGWTKINQGGASATPIAIFLGVAGVASSLTIASSASVLGAYTGHRITGWGTANVQYAFANGSGFTPTPPALSPIQGAIQYLFVVVAANDKADPGAYQSTSAPTGFSNFQSAGTGGSGSTADAGIATAELIATTGREVPGSFGTTDPFSDTWTTATIAIPAALPEPVNASAAMMRASLF